MKKHEKILQCPVSGQPLLFVDSKTLLRVNNAIEKQNLFYLNGTAVSRPLSGGYITGSGDYLYEIENGIIKLLSSYAIALSEIEWQVEISPDLDGTKKSVQQFYNEVGWKNSGVDQFVDADEFEDLRPVASEYIHKCHLRLKKVIADSGEYILDAASGPIQYPEYLEYSADYSYRVCVDFSIEALQAARRKIGDKGVYILADITNLPFVDNVMDAVISLHTIYHVPSEEQLTAFKELYRTIKPGRTGVVVYSWGSHSLFMKIALSPVKLLKIALTATGVRKDQSMLYFEPFNYRWLVNKLKDLKIANRVFVWRGVSVTFLKAYIHRFCAGRFFLDWLYNIENSFPELFGHYGAYPMIVLEKK